MKEFDASAKTPEQSRGEFYTTLLARRSMRATFVIGIDGISLKSTGGTSQSSPQV